MKHEWILRSKMFGHTHSYAGDGVVVVMNACVRSEVFGLGEDCRADPTIILLHRGDVVRKGTTRSTSYYFFYYLPVFR